MTTSFDRTVGPKADVSELMYISALHQTSFRTRSSGTISTLDVQRFLKSRHSLEITHKQACDIIRGLGGGGGAEASYEIRESIAIRVANRIRLERAQAEKDQQDHVTKWKTLGTSTSSSAAIRNRRRNNRNGTLAAGASTTKGRSLVGDEEEAQLLVEEALDPKLLYLDLVQVMSIILMPTLARMGKLWREKNDDDKGKGKAQWEATDETDEGLDPKPDDLLELVWKTMCNVIHSKSRSTANPNVMVGNIGSTEDGFEAIPYIAETTEDDDDEALPPRITAEMVRLLLLENGEAERANDPLLIQDMVDMARGTREGGDGKSDRFDMAAFVRALTSDLQDWDVGCEDRISTYVSDICEDSRGDDNYASLEQLIISSRSLTTTDWGRNESRRSTRRSADNDLERGDKNNKKMNTSRRGPSVSPDDDKNDSPRLEEVAYKPAKGEDEGHGAGNIPLLPKKANDEVDLVQEEVEIGLKIDNSGTQDGSDGEGKEDKSKQISPGFVDHFENDRDRKASDDEGYGTARESEVGSDGENSKELCNSTTSNDLQHNSVDVSQLDDNHTAEPEEDQQSSKERGNASPLLSKTTEPTFEVDTDEEGGAHENGEEGGGSSLREKMPDLLDTANQGGEPTIPSNRPEDTDKPNAVSDVNNESQGEDAEFEDEPVETESYPPPPTDTPENTKSQEQATTSLSASTLAPDPVQIRGSAKIIDSVVDSFASTFTLCIIWITLFCHSGTYASLVLQTDFFMTECTNKEFGCTLGKTVYTWLIVALMLTAFGFAVLVPLSYGNHPTKRGPLRMFVAALLAAVVTFVPFTTLTVIGSTGTTVDPAVQEFVERDFFVWIVYATTAFGSLLVLNYFLHFLIAVAREWNWIKHPSVFQDHKSQNVISIFSTTSNVIATARMKRAATRKVNLMLVNARDMHGPAMVDDGDGGKVVTNRKTSSDALRMEPSDAVFQNYTLRGERTVKAGSLVWTWQMILSGELFEGEGIWLPSRLIIFQVGQFFFSILSSVALFYLVEVAAEEADRATAEITAAEKIRYPAWVLDLVPEGSEVRGALLPAASVSTFVCFMLTVIYLPSTVRTVLKFRCGQLQSLGDAFFHDARAKADKTHMNTANAIYGMMGAAFLFFFLIGLIIFLFLWDFSRDFALLILAWAIGLTITTLSKTIITSMCRKRFFRALYRTFPGRANFSTLALECWYIGLGGGVMVGRITQFLLASAFWIGRIDEPFLASNVALFGYKFDYVPHFFVTELLVHEAHRHPFLERMGAMYLMRLRHRSFGSDAGGCWRQLFVLTLMPWLMKHRVFHEQRCIESVKDQESESEIQRDEDKDALASLAQELLGTTGEVAGIVDKGAKAVGDVGLGAVDVGVNILSMRAAQERYGDKWHMMRASF